MHLGKGHPYVSASSRTHATDGSTHQDLHCTQTSQITGDSCCEPRASDGVTARKQ